MNVIRTQGEMRSEAAAARDRKQTIGLVPTMGALHEGHLSLLRAARSSSDVVVMSVFVNPLQFGPHEDFSAYPRTETEDLAVAEEEKVDIAFLPSIDEMYPEGRTTVVNAGPIGEILEGAHRPGHFEGVCTVVAKLFNVVQPDRAFFGQKDAQQAAVIRRMARDLSFATEIVVCPIVRASDGLAMSSRNSYLSDDERRRATCLYAALKAGRRAFLSEGVAAAESTMLEVLSDAGAEPDYARAVAPTFAEPGSEDAVLLVVAARVGGARLIDNLLVTHDGEEF
ncbi:MAG: pantoate--beta-alanine ligase [Actinomycetota bacterium]